MSSRTFHISGHTIHQQTRQGIPNLRVEAWVKKLMLDDLKISLKTNDKVQFLLVLPKIIFGYASLLATLMFSLFEVFCRQKVILLDTCNNLL